MKSVRLGRWCALFCFFILSLMFHPKLSLSQTETFCALGDSVLADSIVIFTENDGGGGGGGGGNPPPPPTFHDFGDPLFTNEFDLYANNDFKAFRQVFHLHLTEHVSTRFSTGDWEGILNAIMNNDTTATDDDVFSKVWNYFVRDDADSNSYHAGVRFKSGTFGPTYTWINIYLYDPRDAPFNYSFANDNNVWVRADSDEPTTFILGEGLAHELQHICFDANGYPDGYLGINESLSTVAEYLLDGWGHIRPYNLSYDASFMDHEPCDIGSFLSPKYRSYKAWMLYLYEVLQGNSSDPTDDALYRWVRIDAGVEHRLWLDTLAELLWDDGSYDWIGGANATDRLNRLYANFLAAKYCNAPDFAPTHGEFGIGPVNTVTDLGFFTDNDDFNVVPNVKSPDTPIDCPPYENLGNLWFWTVRVLVPSYTLDGDDDGVTTSKAHLYYAADTSRDSIDVYNGGTDYVEFRAGSYFNDGEEHELHLKVRGRPIETGATNGIKPVGWVLGYSSNDDTLQVHPEHLVFVEPLSFTPTTTTSDSSFARTVIVGDFGRSVKAVVLAIGSAGLRPDLNKYPTNGFTYSYSYGVATPGASARTWEGDVYLLGDATVPSGGSLDVAPGTHVKISNEDLAEEGADTDKVEINVSGELIADGTYASPITFKPWTPTTSGDWNGIYVANGSDGATLDYCTIRRADRAIDTYEYVTFTHCNVDTCAEAGFLTHSGGGLVRQSVFNQPGYFGIYVSADTLVVKNSGVTDATIDGIHLGDFGARLVARSTGASGSPTGLYVDSSAMADVDSCEFSSNDVGVHYYACHANSSLKHSSFESDTDQAILCDNGSSPTIDDNYIVDSGDGIYCSNSSSPVIKNNYIKRCTNGVVTASSSNPDIGHYSTTGNNSIAHALSKYIKNLNSSGTIYAQNNCWNVDTGGCSPSSSRFQGSVDYTNPICCDIPRDDQVYIIPGATPKPSVTQLVSIVPNPFNPQTTIHYSLEKQGRVEINVYDVQGRLVQQLTAAPPGGRRAFCRLGWI
jgi:parallel beta-helix repeat protein